MTMIRSGEFESGDVVVFYTDELDGFVSCMYNASARMYNNDPYRELIATILSRAACRWDGYVSYYTVEYGELESIIGVKFKVLNR